MAKLFSGPGEFSLVCQSGSCLQNEIVMMKCYKKTWYQVNQLDSNQHDRQALNGIWKMQASSTSEGWDTLELLQVWFRRCSLASSKLIGCGEHAWCPCNPALTKHYQAMSWHYQTLSAKGSGPTKRCAFKDKPTKWPCLMRACHPSRAPKR